MSSEGESNSDRIVFLLVMPIIALILVHVDSTLMDLSLLQMAVLALSISIALHEVLLPGIRKIREKTDV
ncbi:hypothetical protein [Natrinema sp. H-ect4]|uniref:hypothetical protein n=1 Tax=Natrinema sp. H-ect4 TaxID=3242699 RepID=UPI0035A90F82